MTDSLLQLGNANVNDVLASASGGLLLDPAVSCGQREAIVRALALRGRREATVREAANLLSVTPLSRRVAQLVETGQLLGALGLRQDALQCFREALDQQKCTRNPSKGVSVQIEECIRRLREPDQRLHTLTRRNSDAAQLIERVDCALRGKEAVQANPFAHEVVENHRRLLAFQQGLEKTGLFQMRYLDREQLLGRLISAIAGNTVTAAVYRDIVCSDNLRTQLRLLLQNAWADDHYDLRKLPATEADVSNAISQLRSEGHGSNAGSRYASVFTLQVQAAFIDALKAFQQGHTAEALGRFEQLAVCCRSVISLCVYSPETVRRFLDFHSNDQLVRAAVQIGTPAVCYSTVCRQKLVDPASPFTSLLAALPELSEYSKTLSNFFHQANQLQGTTGIDKIAVATTLGRLAELQAIGKAHLVALPHNKRVYKLDDTFLERLISSYATAATLSKPDSPLVPRLFDKILWGVLAHGGLSLNCFWVLRRARDLVLLHSDCALFSHEDRLYDTADCLSLEPISAEVLAVADKLYEPRYRVDGTDLYSPQRVRCTAKYATPQCFFDAKMHVTLAEQYVDMAASGYELGVSARGDVMRGILKGVSGATRNKIRKFTWNVFNLLEVERFAAVYGCEELEVFLDKYYRRERDQ